MWLSWFANFATQQPYIRSAHRFYSYLLKREIERKAVTKAALFAKGLWIVTCRSLVAWAASNKSTISWGVVIAVL